jgi:hypothetical protein
MPQFSDDLYLGTAFAGGAGPAALNPDGTSYVEPSPMDLGVGPLGRIYVFDLVPATASNTSIVNAQAVAAAGAVTLAATAPITLDRTGRCLRFASSNAGDTTQTVTVTGTDMYGQAMSETRTLNGTSAVNGTKAFYTVTGVTASAALTGNLSVGTRDAYGLPVRVTDAAYVVSAKWDATLADNAGTFTAADTTSPATATTTDVRGVFAQTGNAANGTRRLVMAIALNALACGPNATRAGAFGVNQNLAT